MAPAAAAPRPPLHRFPPAAAARRDDVTAPRRSHAAPPLCPHLGRARAAGPGAGPERSVPSRTGLGALVPAPSPGHALSVLRRTSCTLRGWFHFSQSRQRSLAGGRCLSGTPWREGAVGSVGPTAGFTAQPSERDVAPSPEPHRWFPG